MKGRILNMRRLKYILCTGLMGLALNSCYDMDFEPKGILDEPALFGNEFGVKKYFSGIYNLLPIEDFNYNIKLGFRYNGYENSYWQAAMFSSSANSAEWTGQEWAVHGDGFAYWPYEYIRDVNNFIQEFPKYQSAYDEQTYNALLGEAHFLRAFYYFGLAKRYGGVPLVDKPQDATAPDEELRVSRSTESATWHFIHNDLEIAINNLKKDKERGRANKFVAAALMSRAMLYAGSIAKYGGYSNMGGQASEMGLVGIPSQEAEYFFSESYKASKLILTEGGYSLYRKSGDKEQDYVDLFLDNMSSEDIFIKEFSKNSPHNLELKSTYDCVLLPSPDFSSWGESCAFPTYDIANLFEHPSIENKDGTPHRFNTREEFLEGMEPRLKAIMYFSGMTLRDKKFDIQRGLYRSFQGTVADAAMGDNNAPINQSQRILAQTLDDMYEGNKVCGQHGFSNAVMVNRNTRTGMYVRKYIDYRLNISQVTVYGSEQPWKVFRLGEIYVNHAEAAYELGLLQISEELKEEAFDAIAIIRDRAGATSRTYNPSPVNVGDKYGYPLDENLQFIRDERERELCFENHRWWDIRRWRTADVEFKNFVPTSLMAYYVLDEGKYIFLQEKEPWNKTWYFEKKWYYEPIPLGEIGKNPNLNPQNPLY